jgi:hypothetical protein
MLSLSHYPWLASATRALAAARLTAKNDLGTTDIAECTVTSAFVSASSVAFSSPWSCELRAEEEGSSLRRVSSLGGVSQTCRYLFSAQPRRGSLPRSFFQEWILRWLSAPD